MLLVLVSHGLFRQVFRSVRFKLEVAPLHERSNLDTDPRA
jgi:hypothetical protein